MSALNEDILQYLVGFIPSETLGRINSCTPVFYAAWLKSRYATLTLEKRDKEMKRLLLHLCDPTNDVANHVKCVVIRPWLVQPRTKSPRSFTENLIVQFCKVFDPHYTKKRAEQRLQKRLRKDTINVTSAFKRLKHLEEYSIEWDDARRYHAEFYKEFLAPALGIWSSHLLKLTIKVPPAMLTSLAHVHLARLETLVFHFSTGYLSAKDIDAIHEGFVVFVNNLKDSLQSLTFISTLTSQELDISHIFRKMGFFPLLRRVSLSIPFDGTHLPDPMSFVRFLEKHRATLKDIDIFASRCGPRAKPGDPEYINWIQRILISLHVPLPQLRGLGVALRPLRTPLDRLAVFLDIHSSTLDSLTLTDRALDASDLKCLFQSSNQAQISSITTLQIKVNTLSFALLDDLALLFPGLKVLRVECSRVVLPRLCDRERSLASVWFSIASWNLQQLAISPSHHLCQAMEQDLLSCLPDLTVTGFDA